ncbi:MAG TPA: sialidase family protein [Gemmatimonadaceae bacterium]|jgi:hypothetical protein|nr:sialidase family protein [Gemmatimonadaceae bacterium]
MALAAGRATAQTIRVVSDVLVDATPNRSIQEPFIAVDPRNPSHLLAAVMVVPPAGATIKGQRCAVFFSLDGGAHWRRHDFPIVECYDPWLAFLPDGSALFSALGVDPILAGQDDGLLVYRSHDGGGTWVPRPAALSWGWDHPMLAVDTSSSKRRGWVYLVSSRDQHQGSGWFVAVARSVDGGATFDAPRAIAPDHQMIKAESPAVLSDGTLVVPYVEIAESGILLPRRRAWLVRSTNGIDFSPPTPIGDACGPPPTFVMSSLAAGPFAGNGGGTPSHDALFFSCTLSGFRGVVITHSADGGKTWTPSVSLPSIAMTGKSNRLLMATAATSAGVVGVVWLQHRDASPAGCRDVYLTASFDHGATFTTPVRVSQASSCPNAKLNGPHGSYGDYFGLAADSRGRFRVAWADARTGLFQLRTALIDVEGVAPPRR